MTEQNQPETLEAFKNSFAYGRRTDLNFKFLARLTPEEAGQFLQELLWKLGDAFDDGQFDRVVDHVYQWQVQGYAGEGRWSYEEGPFTPLEKPLSELRVGLLTSSGHFVAGDDPQPFGVPDMTQQEAIERISEFLRAEPTLSSIPFNTPPEKLRVRHGGYDIRGAQQDPNVALPLAPLQTLHQQGLIGDLAPAAYSFVGACAQNRLLKDAGPRWIELFHQQHIEAVLLVPV